jgi:hypothetical protein
MNSKHLIIASIVLFGSIWGLAELGLGELAWANSIPRAAILTAIGVIFLVLGRRVWAFARADTRSVLVLSPALTFVSFVAFAYFARDVLHNPYWSMPDKMVNYMFVQGPVATVLALPAALAGLKLSSYLTRPIATWSTGRWLAYRIAAAGSGAAGVAAALALRY